MGNFKKLTAVLLICIIALVFSGCEMITSIDDMYALPQLPNKHVELQREIETILASGAEYSAPTSGTNRSAVQLIDLDGSGEDEAVAYLKVPGDNKPLKIYIFSNPDEDGKYLNKLVIEGEGTSIDSVTYADMNGDGVSEVIVGWQISTDVKIMYIYSIKGNQVSPLVSTEYTAYVAYPLGGSSGYDVVVIKVGGTYEVGEAIAYSLMEDGEIVSNTAYLSKNIKSVSRIRSNYLNDATPALYIESMTESGIVTDILAYKRNKIENITLDGETGVSTSTARIYRVYSTDINGDGIIEVPRPEQLIAQSETTSYYILKWYTYNEKSERKLAMTTYHNYSDGWYLNLPEDWIGNISIRRTESISGERVIIFSVVEGDGTFNDFLKIYTFTGENKYDRAEQSGRFIITENVSSNTLYVGEMLTTVYDLDISFSIELIQTRFNIIYTEWITGEV